jgi:spore coat protein A, manganese oxidase
VEAKLGTVTFDPGTGAGVPQSMEWMDPVTENPAVGATEVWEFYNTTADAHPMHIHELVFQVVDRQPIEVEEEEDAHGITVRLAETPPRPPEPWETGFKDTVIAYPGEVTRVRAQFNTPGQYVWHCHIVEHEDNEMMRPYRIGPADPHAPDAGPTIHLPFVSGGTAPDDTDTGHNIYLPFF